MVATAEPLVRLMFDVVLTDTDTARPDLLFVSKDIV